MDNHKYSLKKYTGRDSRTFCPRCEKREFVLYVDNQTNEPLNNTVGKCERSINCGYHLTPREWFEAHPDTRTCRTSTIGTTSTKRYEPPKQIDYLPFDIVKRSVDKTLTQNGTSDFARWLALQFDQHTMERIVWERLVREYCLGTWDDNGTVFWQIDIQGKVRTGQVIHHKITADYNDCKRNHDKHPNWIHNQMQRLGQLSTDFNMVQSLFGEHLVGRDQTKVIALTEGQKNAVIGSGVCPQWVWVATAGKSNLSAERLRILKGRNVLVFADLDAHDTWSEKLKGISKEVGFQYQMFDEMRKIATESDIKQGLDVTDWLLNKFEKQKQ